MSGKLPRVTASDVIKVLEKIGFSLVRQSGSHKFIEIKVVRELLYLIMLGRFCILKH